MLKEYETIVILKPEIDIGKIKDFKNKISEQLFKYSNLYEPLVEDMGKKSLAYEVKKHTEGYYLIFTFILDTSIDEVSKDSPLTELDCILREDENVLKFLTIGKDDKSIDIDKYQIRDTEYYKLQIQEKPGKEVHNVLFNYLKSATCSPYMIKQEVAEEGDIYNIYYKCNTSIQRSHIIPDIKDLIHRLDEDIFTYVNNKIYKYEYEQVVNNDPDFQRVEHNKKVDMFDVLYDIAQYE